MRTLTRTRLAVIRRIQQLSRTTKNGNARIGWRVDLTARVAGLELTMTVLTDDFLTQEVDTNL